MPKHADNEEVERLKAELAEQTELADIGELAGQVNHKFNNFLNSLLLRMSLLEAELPPSALDNFTDMRWQAKQIAEIIRQTQQFHRGDAPNDQIHDLNRLLRRAVETAVHQPLPGASSCALRLELNPRNAHVAGSVMDYQRLLSFLLRHRLTALGPPSRTVTVRSQVNEEKVLITIADTHAEMTASHIANLFEPDPKAVEGTRQLVLAACKAIVRRLQGRISAAPWPNGGLMIEAEFPLAT